MDYKKACKTLLNAIAHCRLMVECLQDAPGASEPGIAKVINDILIVLANARGEVSLEILSSLEKE